MGVIVIILYFIVAYSISFLFVYSMGPFDIIDKFRNLIIKISPSIGKVFDCMYCFPTWVGIGLSLINQFLLPNIGLTPFYLLMGGITPWFVILILDMLVTSGTVYIIDCITKRLIGEVDNG